MKFFANSLRSLTQSNIFPQTCRNRNNHTFIIAKLQKRFNEMPTVNPEIAISHDRNRLTKQNDIEKTPKRHL